MSAISPPVLRSPRGLRAPISGYQNLTSAQREWVDHLMTKNGCKSPSPRGTPRSTPGSTPGGTPTVTPDKIRRGSVPSVSPRVLRRGPDPIGLPIVPTPRRGSDPAPTIDTLNMKALGDALSGADAGLNSTGLVFEAHQVFTFADRDRNGSIDRGELDFVRRILDSIPDDLIPAPLTKQLADRAMTWEKIDTDGNGTIDRNEWVAYVIREARVHGERPMLRLMQVLAKNVNDMWIPGM